MGVSPSSNVITATTTPTTVHTTTTTKDDDSDISPCRQICGYVTSGVKAIGISKLSFVGIGLIRSEFAWDVINDQLCFLKKNSHRRLHLKQGQCFVLVRNISSRQYRGCLATIRV